VVWVTVIGDIWKAVFYQNPQLYQIKKIVH